MRSEQEAVGGVLLDRGVDLGGHGNGGADEGWAVHLPAPQLPGLLVGLALGAGEDEGRRGQDRELVLAAPVPGQAVPEVGAEGLTGPQGRGPPDDHVGVGGGRLPVLAGVTGVQDDRPVREGSWSGGRASSRAGFWAGFWAGEIEQGAETAGPVGSGPQNPGPSGGQLVEIGEPPGHLGRLVEGRVGRPDQAEVLGHCGQAGQHGERVRSPEHVDVQVELEIEVTGQGRLLGQPQPVGEQEEVEPSSLRGAGQAGERVEAGAVAGGRVAPSRVVHAGRPDGKTDLFHALAPGAGGVARGHVDHGTKSAMSPA